MNIHNPSVDLYLEEGCGRCDFYRTPQCKVHSWTKEIQELRRIVLDCGLLEEYKWSQPCYTYHGANVVIVSAFKESATIAFFKGSLLEDPHNLLVAPGKNSQASRMIRFTSTRDILDIEPILKSYIAEAIEIERSGKKVVYKKKPEPIPEELQLKFEENPAFKAAFENLTPGRQRGYILHFSQAKQSKTRSARIEKYMPKIFEGKGISDY